ncbi:MAG: hypothetical protein IKL07_06290, partial [Clostridium sp.]|nr:hypothetical protein [Clostridium sp.]
MRKYLERFVAVFLSLLLVVGLLDPNVMVLRGEEQGGGQTNPGSIEFVVGRYNETKKKVFFDFPKGVQTICYGAYLMTYDEFEKISSEYATSDFSGKGTYTNDGDDTISALVGKWNVIEKNLFDHAKEIYVNKENSCSILWYVVYSNGKGSALPLIINGNARMESKGGKIQLTICDNCTQITLNSYDNKLDVKNTNTDLNSSDNTTNTADFNADNPNGKVNLNIKLPYSDVSNTDLPLEVVFGEPVPEYDGIEIDLGNDQKLHTKATFTNPKTDETTNCTYVGKDGDADHATLNITFSGDKEIVKQVIEKIVGKDKLPKPSTSEVATTEAPTTEVSTTEAPTTEA